MPAFEIFSTYFEASILNEDKQVDFDFLIAGQYITDTLQKHIASEDVGTVSQICIDGSNEISRVSVFVIPVNNVSDKLDRHFNRLPVCNHLPSNCK